MSTVHTVYQKYFMGFSFLLRQGQDFLLEILNHTSSQDSKEGKSFVILLNPLQARLFYLLTNWLAYLYGRIQSPRPDVMPDRREDILQNLSCSSNNLVYLINCKRFIKKDPTLPCQYIGQTCRTLRERFGEHRRGIENNIDESVPIHFNQPKHTLNDVQVILLLHVNSNRDSIRFSMEQHLIDKAGTLQNGHFHLLLIRITRL